MALVRISPLKRKARLKKYFSGKITGILQNRKTADLYQA